MKIFLISNHFYPEEFRCNDLAFELAARGHQVTVLTAIPDYPKGKYHKGYGIFQKRIEIINGVKVYHSFIIPRGSGNKVRLMLNYGSSLLAQCWDSFWLALFRRFDYVLVHETSPVMVGLSGLIVSKIRRIPMDFWVLDLWPESLQDAGGVNNKKLLSFFGKITAFIYKYSSHILISSKGFQESICEKGDFSNKIVYFPNWADLALERSAGLEVPQLPHGFCLLFAGNIGEAQDMEHLMATALELKDEKDIHFCLVGDGRKRLWVDTFINKNDLKETVHLLGRYPIEAMPSIFASADVLLLSLKDSNIFNRTVPAKLQAYMNAGKPIAAMMNGEGPAVIDEAKCGFSVAAGDSSAFVSLIKRMKNIDKKQLLEMGMNGKKYCQENFDFLHSVELIEKLMKCE